LGCSLFSNGIDKGNTFDQYNEKCCSHGFGLRKKKDELKKEDIDDVIRTNRNEFENIKVNVFINSTVAFKFDF